MRPPEDKNPLASRKPARRISAQDFLMPKPYEKPITAAPKVPMSRARIAMLAGSGLIISSLLAAVALLVHENATTPRPLMVIDMPEAPPAKPARRGGNARLAPGSPKPQAAQPKGATHDAQPVLAPAALVPGATALEAATDPDVELIAAILMLSAAPLGSVPGSCGAAIEIEQGCAALPPMTP